MPNSKDIENVVSRIDFTNLCGGNDFAALTNGYDRKKINELVWDKNFDDIQRDYLHKAIYIQKKLDKCSDDDDDLYEKLLGEQIKIQKEYNDEIRKEQQANNKLSDIENKTRGYSTTEWGVFFYFMCDSHHIYLKNDDNKNCDQDAAIKIIAKATGYSESSYIGKLNLNFTESATRKAMKKVATDFKELLPALSNEIMRQYEEYEEDYSQIQREKKQKKYA